MDVKTDFRFTRHIYSGRLEFIKTSGPSPSHLDQIDRVAKTRPKDLHPNRVALPERFHQLQAAYDEAHKDAQLSLLDRDWLARNLNSCFRQLELIDEIHQYGGKVRVEKVGWSQGAAGEYASVLERICELDFSELLSADSLLRFLVQHTEDLQHVQSINLSHSSLTSAGLIQIGRMNLERLRRLNLAGTRATTRALKLAGISSELAWLNLTGIQVNWLTRMSLRRHFPKALIEYGRIPAKV